MKALNDDLQMRSDWVLPLCTGQERLKNATARKTHPTQKPEALLHRVLLAATRPGDVVLDPFFGTGTTGAVARRLRPALHRHRARPRLRRGGPRAHRPGRSRSPTPIDAGDHRPSATSRGCRSAALLERGLLTPGDLLFDRQAPAPGAPGARRRHPDHRRTTAARSTRSGALVQGAPACNGWTFWHFRQGEAFLPIDVLRQKIRAELH